MSRRVMAVLSAVFMVLSVTGPIAANTGGDVALADKFDLQPADAQLHAANPFADASEGVFLIRLADEPLATYAGGAEGLPGTSRHVTGEKKLNAKTPNAKKYQQYLLRQHKDFIKAAEELLGHKLDVRQQYTNSNNGIAAWLTPDEAASLMKMTEVTFIQPDEVRELHTDVGPAWIGAPAIWGGPDCSGEGACGEGMVIGVIDTGINPSNPSFADIGGDGYDHTNPKGKLFGVCDPLNTSPSNPDTLPFDPTLAPLCNDKLIGMWGYASILSQTGFSPIDYNGHGSHTASTAGGNFVFDVPVVGSGATTMVDISGVAPHANIIAYGACCTLSALSAAIDQAVEDGVDAINYSIGSTAPSDVWNDFDTVGYLNAREAGIFVATSAGNSGPGDDTVGSPGDAPWLTTVAASSHDRSIQNTLIDMVGGDTTPPADILGKGFTGPLGSTPIVYAGDFGFPLCDPGAFAPGTFSGEIVVCDRGAFGRVAKSQSVADGGAGGYVLANDPGNANTLNGDAFAVPGVHITHTDGVALKTWLASGTGHMASIGGFAIDIDPSHADAITAFSSRGANRAIDVLVPNVAAPGLDVIAADGVGDAVEWGIISGTSMASPHVAGAGALVMQAHPTWTPAEVQSALMMTAHQGVVDELGNAADPFDMGSGRVDLAAATNSGLVMDESIADYLAADPATGGDPRQINTPSVANGSCVGTCSWTRTVKAVVGDTWTVSASAEAGASLTVSPSSFTLSAGQEQVLTIEADVSGAPSDVWLFGQIDMTPAGSSSPAHLPAAMRGTTGDLPDEVKIWTRRNAGSHPVTGLTAIEITDLTVDVSGLALGDETNMSLSQDPTNGDPYDNVGDGTVEFITVDVPEGADQLVAEIPASEAPDIDLFVGTGDTPSAATQICSSTTGSFIELCRIDDPAAGTYWVLVQNWNGSDDQPDATELITAVVHGDAGNMDVDGPHSVPALEPFDIRVIWDEPAMQAHQHWYGEITLGTDEGNHGNIGTIPVRLVRHDDDVTKTVSADTAVPGDTLTYDITIQPNLTDENLEYWITDTIPDGLTYVEGSATNGATVTDGVLEWHGDLPSPALSEGSYVQSTSIEDPLCGNPFGGYVNLEDFGIGPDPLADGDTFALTAFTGGADLEFYGTLYDGVAVTDDGFIVFDPTNNYGGQPWTPQALPSPDLPNNLAAGLWFDGEVFHDPAAFEGISLAITGETEADLILIEYDDLTAWSSDEAPGPSIGDFEITMRRQSDPTPGVYEIIYDYANLNVADLPAAATIGVENVDGTDAASLLNVADPDGTIADGFSVCYDWAGATFDPVTISYDVTVDADADGVLTNLVVSTTSDPGSQPAETSVDVLVEGIAEPTIRDIKMQAIADLEAITPSSPLTAELIAKAIMNVELSLDPARWQEDGNRLTNLGSKVFAFERRAVRWLRFVERERLDDAALVTPIIATLTEADEMLAVIAIQDAIDRGADPDAIAAAEFWLEVGRSKINELRAIANYRRAWTVAFFAEEADNGPI